MVVHLRAHHIINNVECFATMLHAATHIFLWTRHKLIDMKTVLNVLQM